MSVWIQNARAALESKSVLLLHGNVRDLYIDKQARVYDNLTALLTEFARSSREPVFTDLVLYDPSGQMRETRLRPGDAAPPAAAPPAEDDLAATAPESRPDAGQVPPARVLAGWRRDLTAGDRNRFAVLYYLDKLVSYKPSYGPEELKLLLWLEKIIENITPNHRLVLVALQDAMIPLELYTNSPKCRVLPAPAPDKEDRGLYLRSRLGKHPHGELIADLTDGLSLREVDDVAAAVRRAGDVGGRDVRRVINRYRIGDQQDYWGALDVERLNGAFRWFTQTEGVKGQDEAVLKVVQKLILARAGLTGMASGTTTRPRAVLFFAGPTGVGKTLLAKKLAKFLFAAEDACLRFDMSELKEEHTVSKLIGSPPGYVGYERGGALTGAVRERPFAVVLFDEIEKAHPRILDVFLQLLDEGRLTDSRGQTVFFTEAVVVFTSNLGCRSTNSRGQPALVGDTGLTEEQAVNQLLADQKAPPARRAEAVRRHFVRAVEEFFTLEISRPELLNRIGGAIVPFNYIQTEDVQREIVAAQLKRVQDDFADKFRQQGHRLTAGPEAADHLAARHGERMGRMGGRGVADALEQEVLGPLGREVLAAEVEGRRRVEFRIEVHDGRIEVEAAGAESGGRGDGEL